jgi:ribosomal protein S18 acetylase RimI-like enzyme
MDNTSLKSYQVKSYDHTKKLEPATGKQIVSLYTDVFSKPPWNYEIGGRDGLAPNYIRKEMDFFTVGNNRSIITAQTDTEVIGFRFVTRMDNIVQNADTNVKSLVEQLSKIAKAPPEKISFTLSFGVDETYRRNGVASAMMAQHFNQAKESGCDYVIGCTLPSNEAMIRSYHRQGYQEITNQLPRDMASGIDLYTINGKPTFVIDVHKKKDQVYYMKDIRNLLRT